MNIEERKPDRNDPWTVPVDEEGQLAASVDLRMPDMTASRHLRKVVGSQLMTQGLERGRSDRILLALTEIVNNLMKHSSPQPDLITVRISRAKSRLRLLVTDNGGPFLNFYSKARESAVLTKTGEPAESGLGLGIISSLFPDHSYTPIDKDDSVENVFELWDPARQIVPKLPRIFVVDDDPALRALLIALLKDEYEIILFECGEDALEGFIENAPELIISDVRMPGLDGIGLRRALSRLDGGDLTPFIFLTAQADIVTEAYATELGIDDYLIKPVGKQRLIAVIKRLLGRSHQLKDRMSGDFGQEVTGILQPSLPKRIGNWSVAIRNAAADIGGGDLVLFHEFKTGHALALADVMGHGLSAKFFAYAYAGYLRSLLRLQPDRASPADLLSNLSATIAKDPLLDAVLITCLASRLEHGGILKLASAGHPPPFMIDEQGCQPIATAGPLPGLVGDSTYRSTEIELKPGQRVMMYTDGLIEVSLNDIERTRAQRAILGEAHNTLGMDIETAANRIYTVFKYAAPSGLRDDATFILLEYNPD
ncbi:MAG: SpoIIE family protein phosphatase [Pseudomonadota bacterium]|nr:SpoIIE family protein phosphatase [Pseudomonadota bacterium]